MTFTFQLDLDSVMMNQQANYIGLKDVLL